MLKSGNPHFAGAVKGALAAGPMIGMKQLIERATKAGALSDADHVSLLQAVKRLNSLGIILMQKTGDTVRIELVEWRSQFEADQDAVLNYLRCTGTVKFGAIVEGCSLPSQPVSAVEAKCRILASLKTLVRAGAVASANAADGRTFKISSTGLHAIERRSYASPTTAILSGLGIAGATMLVAGCMSASKQEARTPLMGYPVPVGIQQVRSLDGGTHFEPCNPCAGVTQKTPVLALQREQPNAGELASTGAATGGTPAAQTAQLVEMGEVQERIEVASAIKAATDRAHKEAVGQVLSGGASLQEALKMDTTFASAKRVVPFSFAAGDIGPQGRAMVAQMLPYARQAQRMYIRGRTDSSGKAEANKALAMTRALKVRGEFVSGGVDHAKIKTTYCTSCYIASNDTEAGRRANRRVEIEIVLPQMAVHALQIDEMKAAAASKGTHLATEEISTKFPGL